MNSMPRTLFYTSVALTRDSQFSDSRLTVSESGNTSRCSLRSSFHINFNIFDGKFYLRIYLLLLLCRRITNKNKEHGFYVHCS